MTATKQIIMTEEELRSLIRQELSGFFGEIAQAVLEAHPELVDEQTSRLLGLRGHVVGVVPDDL